MAVLRQKYPAANLTALKVEIARVLPLALANVTITASSSEGASQSGEISLPRMDYLAALIDLQQEIDPDFIAPPTGDITRYANHGCRYVE